MRYEMSAYVAACALQKPKPANFSTIIQVSSRCFVVSPIIPVASRNLLRNRSRSRWPENFADERRMMSASASDISPATCAICITCSWKMHTPSESPRIVSSAGCGYSMVSSPRRRFINNSFDPYSDAPGPNQRQSLSDFFQRSRSHHVQQAAHGRRLDLKYTHRSSRGNHVARRRIVLRYRVKINLARLWARRHAIRRNVVFFLYLLYFFYLFYLFFDVVQRQRHRRKSALPQADPS